MSRKKATFAQLIDYISAGATSERFTFRHNTYTQNTDGIKREFVENARLLRQRKNGVFLYHEILSIKRNPRLTLEEQQAKLAEIVRLYIEARAPRQLAFGMMHNDHPEHLHFHLVISSNSVGSQERERLSKKQFSDIQTHLERYVLERYAELNQQAVFRDNLTPEQREAQKQKARVSQKGAELKRRTGKTPARDQVKETIEQIFSHSRTPQDFTESMNKAGFTLYQRGQYAGIEQDGKKYRFATLGLAEHWVRFDAKMRESMKPQNTPQSDAESVQVHPETSQRTQQNTAQDTPTERVEKPVIVEQVAETFDSLKEEVQHLSGFHEVEQERERRLKEMRAKREQQAKHQNSDEDSHTHRQR